MRRRALRGMRGLQGLITIGLAACVLGTFAAGPADDVTEEEDAHQFSSGTIISRSVAMASSGTSWLCAGKPAISWQAKAKPSARTG